MLVTLFNAAAAVEATVLIYLAARWLRARRARVAA